MTQPFTTRQVLGLLGWLVVSTVVAGIGSAASINAVSFYAQLAQPKWAPPAWLFGPAWTLLFTLMAVSAWLVWRKYGFRNCGLALKLYAAQLIANALWSWLFFGWRLGAIAFAEVIVLWLLIAATIFFFWRLHRAAAILLLPYLAWVTFAAALNFSLWQLNPNALG